MKEIIDEQMVMDEKEQLAITRIQKFSKIAKTMGLEVHLGFSGGKDSQVCYDLCKRAGYRSKPFSTMPLKVILH